MDQNEIQIKDYNTISQVLGKDIVKITPIIGKGDVNRVYIAKQSKQKVIVRINDAVDFPRFEKEAWCLREASNKGITSPILIEMGLKEDMAFMVLNFVPGLNGKAIIENKELVWKTIGYYAKQIHSIKTTRFGERMVAPGEFDDSWARFLDYNISSLSPGDKLRKLGVLTREQSEEIKKMFISLQSKRFNFGVIHGDLSLENVIVEGDTVTLIDWGVAQSTIIPHIEIVDLLQNVLSDTDPAFESFLKGYGMPRAEYESMKVDIETLTLLQAIDKLRWAIDRKPDKIEKISERVKLLVQV